MCIRDSSKVTGILMPFIYGAVIAYLLKPVCNTIEGFLHRIFPEKLHSMASMLAKMCIRDRSYRSDRPDDQRSSSRHR